jgi:protease II
MWFGCLQCTDDVVQVGSVETSPNNKMLAWTEDTSGNEKYTLYVKVSSRTPAAIPVRCVEVKSRVVGQHINVGSSYISNPWMWLQASCIAVAYLGEVCAAAVATCNVKMQNLSLLVLPAGAC